MPGFDVAATHTTARKNVYDAVFVADSAALLSLNLGRYVLKNSNLASIFCEDISKEDDDSAGRFLVGVAGGSLPSILGTAIIAALDEQLTARFDATQHSRQATLAAKRSHADMETSAIEAVKGGSAVPALVQDTGSSRSSTGSSGSRTTQHFVLEQIAEKLARWSLFLVDERVVPLDHKESNYRVLMDEIITPVREFLLAEYSRLCGKPAAQEAIGEYLDSFEAVPLDASILPKVNDPKEAGVSIPTEILCKVARDYEAKIFAKSPTVNGKTGLPEFDLTFIGLGPDGHICSLFPDFPHTLFLPQKAKDSGYTQLGAGEIKPSEINSGADELKNTGELIVSIANSPKPPPTRITFVMPLVNSSKKIAVVTTGKGKAPVIKDILWTKPDDEKSAKSVYKYPLARLVNYSTNSKESPLVWFLDKEAASGAPKEFEINEKTTKSLL